MNKMDQKASEIEPETAAAIIETITLQAQDSFSKVVETDKWLSQHNFLVNAGGAIAVLGYMGTNQSTAIAIAPLSLFIIGIIASGLEIRSLLKFYGLLSDDALRRRGGFINDELSVKEASEVKGVQGIYTKINHWCGIISQLSFASGALLGIIGLSCNSL